MASVPGTDGRAGMAALVVDDGAFDLHGLYERSGRDLAPYARPLFVRIQQEMQVTGTFKHRKVDLVEEGFDPGRINEPLYFRDDAAGRYVQIDPALHDRIARGEVRF